MTAPDADNGQDQTWDSPLRPGAAIVLASFLGLFLELALIRWISCEIRVFAYCKNLVLVASFLGFGIGCLLWRRRSELIQGMFLLLLLSLVVRLQWQSLLDYGPRKVSDVLAALSGLMIFHHPGATAPVWQAADWLWLGFALFWTGAIFFVVALIMVPFGQVTGAAIARFSRPLTAYSLNVGGSLAGILAFTFACGGGLPPICWFVPVALASTYLVSRTHSRSLVAISLALLVSFLPDEWPEYQTHWSSYQKLALIERRDVIVNNIGFQSMRRVNGAPADGHGHVDRFNMPYTAKQPVGRVLVLGAGTGNDIAAALLSGASSVTAVEIDRAVYRIGEALHPQQPYSDPRVEPVIDDARHFLRTTDRAFDLIVFSHLDSHTLLSSYTNIRLDNYIYTVEAFEEARSRLDPGGVVYVSFWSEQPYVSERLFKNLTLAFGHSPVSLYGTRPDDLRGSGRFINFLTAEPETMAQLAASASQWQGFEQVGYDLDAVVASTDSWPFLPLARPSIPPLMLLISLVIFLLSAGLVGRLRPTNTPFDGRVFWLGAAFMLLEVHNVSRLALVFGTTWQVNAWAIGAILTLILVANFVCMGLARRGRVPGSWAVAGLFLSLAAAYLVPLEALTTKSYLIGGTAATLLMTTPVFFAGLVFAQAFIESRTPSFALGWNVLGAVLGGLTENLSYVWGIPVLIPLAGSFYLVALLWPRRPAERDVSDAVVPASAA